MSNICHNCVFHERCMSYRYNNIQTFYMTKVNRSLNKDGNIVIYVEKCDNFTNRKFKYSIDMIMKIKKEKNFNETIDK